MDITDNNSAIGSATANNLNDINFIDLICDDNEAVEDYKFTASASTSAPNFLKQPTLKLQDIMDTISSPKQQKKDSLARADMCRIMHRPRLVINRGRLKEMYGYDIGRETYFCAEEALYLIEIGKLEVYHDHICLSIERARSLLLHSKSHPETVSSKIRSCDVDEYSVFKHLVKLGYRVRRREHISDYQKSVDINQQVFENDQTSSPLLHTELLPTGENGNDILMEVDDEKQTTDFVKTEVSHIYSGCSLSSGQGTSSDALFRRGMKRKISDLTENLTFTSSTSAKDFTDTYNQENVNFVYGLISVSKEVYTTSFQDNESQDMGDFRSHHPHEPNEAMSEIYTVVEADSDIEIVDEVIHSHSGVEIEEIGYDADVEEDSKSEMLFETGNQCTTSATSTNETAQMVVDLVSSDSDSEEDLKSYINVWSKFVPNATVQVGFPPQILLPGSIPHRKDIYEYDLKNKGDRTDLELEYFVDELNLNASPIEDQQYFHNPQNQRVCCKSWKEWRQLAMEEARDVMKESLLASSDFVSSSDIMKKLNLWKGNLSPLEEELELPETSSSKTKNSKAGPDGWSQFHIPFDLYPPSCGRVHKNRLQTENKPSFRVALVRNDEVVPSFSDCWPLVDGVPVVIAIISDESDIIFLTPDTTPLTSLF